jgi:hypothetical protein
VTPGNEEFVRVVTSLVVTLPGVIAIIVIDERRLTGIELDRAWPTLSRDCAILGLLTIGVPQLCVPIHFIRTRRSLLGAVLGLAWLATIVLCNIGAQLAVLATIDWLGL